MPPNNIDFVCNDASLIQEVQQYREAITVWKRAVALSADRINLKNLTICYVESQR